MKQTERQRLEAWFRAERIAYIEVRSAARAVLPDGPVPNIAGPTPIHYVLYGNINLLLWWGKRSPATLRLMRRWEKLFGQGFSACFGELSDRDTSPMFVGSDGAPLDVLVVLGKRTVCPATASPTGASRALHEESVEQQERDAPTNTESSPTLFPISILSLNRERQ